MANDSTFIGLAKLEFFGHPAAAKAAFAKLFVLSTFLFSIPALAEAEQKNDAAFYKALAISNEGLGIFNTTGDRDAAIAKFNEAIEVYPNLGLAWNNKAFMKQLKGLRPEAKADLEEGLKRDPKEAQLWAARGLMSIQDKNFEAAKSDLDEAIKLNPHFSMALGNRGYLRKTQGDLKGARVDYNEAINCDPKNEEAFNNRSLVDWLEGDKAAAIADVQAALKINPKFARALENLNYFNKHDIRDKGATASPSTMTKTTYEGVVAPSER